WCVGAVRGVWGVCVGDGAGVRCVVCGECVLEMVRGCGAWCVGSVCWRWCVGAVRGVWGVCVGDGAGEGGVVE
ncbi:MAG: hypothetical protein NC229_07055, partial [Bacteroides sp.]|nr:hypothetical protein [Bacteroides sp.]